MRKAGWVPIFVCVLIFAVMAIVGAVLTRASPPAALIWFAYCAFLIVIDVIGRRAKLGKARRLMAEWQPHRRG